MKTLATRRLMLALAGPCLLSLGSMGCQSTVGGQTLPSAYFLEDDVQYFPAGPEERLPKLKRALEEYRASRAEYGDAAIR